MKLTYRGVTYNYQPIVLETTESQTVGKYRGLDWRFRNLKKAPILQPRYNLTYRGVTYNTANTTNNSQTEVTKVPAFPSTEGKARALMSTRTHTIKNRQQALLARSSAEIGVNVDTDNYWTRIQGAIQPTFRANYQPSGATMS